MKNKVVFRMNREDVKLQRKRGSTLIERIVISKNCFYGEDKTYELRDLLQSNRLQIEAQEFVLGTYLTQQSLYFTLYAYKSNHKNNTIVLDVMGDSKEAKEKTQIDSDVGGCYLDRNRLT